MISAQSIVCNYQKGSDPLNVDVISGKIGPSLC